MLVNDSSTTSKRLLWPEETRKLWVTDAWESRLCLSDAKIYDDWASALGANTLGYKQIGSYFRPAASLPWQVEHDFAEEFCTAMGTEAVRFFKTGSDAVSCAVRLARAFTGRELIILFDKSYHGTATEFRPIAWQQAGYPPTPAIKWTFGEPISGYLLPKAAAIVVEPVPKAIDIPPEGWLQHLREVANEHGIILISDEIILGYRHDLRGYLSSTSVRADLACYGKAMGQGAAISACTGRLDIMGQLRDNVHFSGTNNGEPLALAIAQATLREYQENNICETLSGRGYALRALLESAGFNTRGLNSRFEVELEDKASAVRYCFEHGILWPGFCSMALTHTPEQMASLVNTLKNWRDSYGRN